MRCSLLTLSTYLDGELAPERAGALEAHLVACPRCTDGLGYLREEQEHIRGLAGVTASAGAANELLTTVGITFAPESEAADEAPGPQFLLELAESRDAAAAAQHDDESENGAIVELSGSAAAAAANGTLAAGDAAKEAATHAGDVERSGDDEIIEEADAGILGPSPPAPPSWSSRYTPAMHARISSLKPAEPERVIPLPEATNPETSELDTADTAAGDPETEAPEAEAEAADPELPETVPEIAAAETTIPEETVPETTALPPALIAPDEPVPETPRESVRPAPPPERTEAPPAASAAPLQAPRPASWLDRARDAVALRWALMRGASPTADDLDDENIQIVSGSGAPSRPRRQPYRPITEAKMPSSAEGGAQRPAAMQAVSPLSPFDSLDMPMEMMAPVEAFDRPVAPSGERDAPNRPAEKERAPTEPVASTPTIEEPAAGTAVAAAAAAAAPRAEATAGRHVRALHGEKRSWKRPRIPGPRPTALPGPMSDRRLWVFGGSVAILALIGVLVGKSTTAPSHNAAGIVPNPTAIAQPTAPALASAAPTVAATPQPTPKPTPVPTPAAPNANKLTGAQNLGSGVTGVSVQDLRYGAHPHDFRIVFDLSGSGSPTTTVGFGSPTTLYVVFTGVTGSASVTQPSSGQEVTAVNLLQPSPISGKTVYEITLASPANLSTIYLQSPLRLVIDLTG
ncbi:MAG TPA: zf-HC2 domain-containing protein [Candidatus Dormibacteraeota bacterium]